jgi:hypothetical protein
VSGWTPSAAAARAAQLALDVRATLPRSQRAGTPTGIARAHQLAARRHVSAQTVARMVAFFARNARFRSAAPASKAWQAWNLWGGDAARAAVERLNPMMCCNPKSTDSYAAAAHAALHRLRANPQTPTAAEDTLRRAYHDAVARAQAAQRKRDKAMTAAAVEDAARYSHALRHYGATLSAPYHLVEAFGVAATARQPDLFGAPAPMLPPPPPRAEQFALFRSNPDDDAWTYAYNTQADDVLEGLSEAELRDELREARAAAAKWTRLAREADAADDYPAGMVAHYRQLADAIEYRLRPQTRSNPALNAEVAAYLDGAERIAQSIIDLHEVDEGDWQAAHLARSIVGNVQNLRRNYALGDPRMARHNAMTAIYVYEKLRELVEYIDDPDTRYKQGARELHAWLEQAARNPLLLNAADYYRDNPRHNPPFDDAERAELVRLLNEARAMLERSRAEERRIFYDDGSVTAGIEARKTTKFYERDVESYERMLAQHDRYNRRRIAARDNPRHNPPTVTPRELVALLTQADPTVFGASREIRVARGEDAGAVTTPHLFADFNMEPDNAIHIIARGPYAAAKSIAARAETVLRAAGYDADVQPFMPSLVKVHQRAARANPVDVELARAFGLAAQKLDKAKPTQRQRTPRATAGYFRELMQRLTTASPHDLIILSAPTGVVGVETMPHAGGDSELRQLAQQCIQFGLQLLDQQAGIGRLVAQTGRFRRQCLDRFRPLLQLCQIGLGLAQELAELGQAGQLGGKAAASVADKVVEDHLLLAQVRVEPWVLELRGPGVVVNVVHANHLVARLLPPKRQLLARALGEGQRLGENVARVDP